MSEDTSDVAQARRLLDALYDTMRHTTTAIEDFEQQRCAGTPPGPQERALRRELSEAHGHVSRIHQRFPETQRSPE